MIKILLITASKMDGSLRDGWMDTYRIGTSFLVAEPGSLWWTLEQEYSAIKAIHMEQEAGKWISFDVLFYYNSQIIKPIDRSILQKQCTIYSFHFNFFFTWLTDYLLLFPWVWVLVLLFVVVLLVCP